MKDYIVIKFEDCNFNEIFLYDHELTNGDITRVQEALDNYNPDAEDIEHLIQRVLPYTNYITISNDDDYHTIWY